MASVISTLATLVSVSATMNAVNITLQQIPEYHSEWNWAFKPQFRNIQPCQPETPELPGARAAKLRCQTGRITSSESAVKKLRQNVTSKLRACSSAGA